MTKYVRQTQPHKTRTEVKIKDPKPQQYLLFHRSQSVSSTRVSLNCRKQALQVTE